MILSSLQQIHITNYSASVNVGPQLMLLALKHMFHSCDDTAMKFCML